ncbi:hypothetical protein KVR01_001953 [Diaporthe batatas]|uniref:uncharacterized protein n=1 Tax=Diaporthe batatas TaxID=748121 RepID=UPI001D03A9FC|nr:uncharacterized protein KVR01_001953 [Diaporthe batatas]KAG8169204.1 hypothetical protein KVR01_001953 [Diaporthe batatas]
MAQVPVATVTYLPVRTLDLIIDKVLVVEDLHHEGGSLGAAHSTHGGRPNLLLCCHPDADEGFVYGFQHPDDVAPDPLLTGSHKWAHLIKIGRSKNYQTRMKQIGKQCKYTPHTVFAHFMPWHGVVERVVHTQLHNSRLRDTGCRGCGARHEEWFQVDARLAEDAVELWKAFVECSPYDEQGGMLPVWRERLEQLDLDDSNCWQCFVHDAPSAWPAAGSPRGVEAENADLGLAAGCIGPRSDGDLGGEHTKKTGKLSEHPAESLHNGEASPANSCLKNFET